MKLKAKCVEIITYTMNRYPERCEECPAFYTRSYQCHNERGVEGHCKLGFMSGDMRDFDGRKLYKNCSIRNSDNVKIDETL